MGFILALGVVMSMGYFAFLNFNQYVQLLSKSVDQDSRLLALEALTADLSETSSQVRNYTITRDTASLRAYRLASEDAWVKWEAAQDLFEQTREESLMDSVAENMDRKFGVLDEWAQMVMKDKNPNFLAQLTQRIVEEAENERRFLQNQQIDTVPALEIVTPDTLITDSAEAKPLTRKERRQLRKKEKQDRPGFLKRIFSSKKKQEEQAAAETPSQEIDSTVVIIPLNVDSTPDSVSEDSDFDLRLQELERLANRYDSTENQYNQRQYRRIYRLNKRDEALSLVLTTQLERLRNAQVDVAIQYAEDSGKQAQKSKNLLYLFGLAALLLFAALLFIIFRDISRNQRLQRRLKQEKLRAEKLSRAKEEFLANMSHEIRTPMNAIIGFSEQLKGTQLGPKQHRFLDSVNHSAHHLLDLLNDVLDYSKLESGKFTLDSQTFLPERLFTECMDTFTHAAQRKGIQLHLEKDAEIPKALVGDPLRLKQMIFNLLNNAIKFTEEGEVRLSCQLEEKNEPSTTLRIAVSDTGIGIPEEKLTQVFEDFSQADTSTTRKYGGSGLGLSITQRLAELQGGEIQVQSEVGKGTTVTLVLPFVIGKEEDAQQEAAPPPISTYSLTELAGTQALIADDDPYNRELIRVILEKWGVDYTLVENGQEVINVLTQPHGAAFDFILMDLHMPELGGIETTEWIRKNHDSELPILALTATSTPTEQQAAIQAGMNEVVLKPFHEHELHHRISQLLGKSSEQPQQTAIASEHIPPSNPDALYQLDELYHLANDNPKIVQNMLRIFVNTATENADKLEEGLHARNAEAVSGYAHKVVPPCRHLGLTPLVENLKDIELSAQESSPDWEELRPKVQDAIDTLRTVISQVKEQLKLEIS